MNDCGEKDPGSCKAHPNICSGCLQATRELSDIPVVRIDLWDIDKIIQETMKKSDSNAG